MTVLTAALNFVTVMVLTIGLALLAPKRWRIKLASKLCSRTSCVVVRAPQLIALQATLVTLTDIVEKSGSIQRGKAGRTIYRAVHGMLTLVQDLLVGGYVHSPADPPPEEDVDGEGKDET